jgi:hypothetical protein
MPTSNRSDGGPTTAWRTAICLSDDWKGDAEVQANENPAEFASIHANVHNTFNLERHLVDRQTYKERRSTALVEWQSLIA